MNLYLKREKEKLQMRQLISGDKYKINRLTLVLTKNQNQTRHKITSKPTTKKIQIVS
jgi:hypothetical protein